jgi:hypothetical protein
VVICNSKNYLGRIHLLKEVNNCLRVLIKNSLSTWDQCMRKTQIQTIKNHPVVETLYQHLSLWEKSLQCNFCKKRILYWKKLKEMMASLVMHKLQAKMEKRVQFNWHKHLKNHLHLPLMKILAAIVLAAARNKNQNL